MAHHAEAQHDGAARAAVSNMMIRVHVEHAGRGPVKARTYMNEDMVACVLEDGLTPVEHTLAAGGQARTVEHIRHSLQEAMRKDMVAGVEQISGRRVRAFLSANQVDPNIAVETFLLETPARAKGSPTREERTTRSALRDPESEGVTTLHSAAGPDSPNASSRQEPSYRTGSQEGLETTEAPDTW
jgi:uncharacterized protein YbcI